MGGDGSSERRDKPGCDLFIISTESGSLFRFRGRKRAVASRLRRLHGAAPSKSGGSIPPGGRAPCVKIRTRHWRFGVVGPPLRMGERQSGGQTVGQLREIT